MTVALARRLVWEGVVTAEESNLALQIHVRERVSFLRALLRRDPGILGRLEAELGHGRPERDAPVLPDPELLGRLPPGLAALFLAVPVGKDPVTGVVRVVAADPSDRHLSAELAHHLGAKVEVVAGPLRRLLEVLADSPADSAADRRSPVLGIKVVSSPANPRPAPPPTDPPLEVYGTRPSEPRPSDRPIPLVRVAPEIPAAPTTMKGVAPQASGPSYASKVMVPPRAAPRVASEPVIQLTRTKSLSPGPPSSKPASSGSDTPPDTLHGHASPAERSSPAASAPPDTAFDDLQAAASPEDVMSVLVRGLSRAARKVVLLALRGKVFEGKETNDGATRDMVRSLVISVDRPSVALTAIQTGQYVGPLPRTAVHEGLSQVLGSPADDVIVGSINVSGRAALVYVLASFDTAYLATRRGEELAAASSRALERIVRERKK